MLFELQPRGRKTLVFLAVDIKHRLVVEHVVKAGSALQLHDLPGQIGAGAARRGAHGDELLGLIGEHTDLQDRIDERDTERHGNEYQTEQHQAAQ